MKCWKRREKEGKGGRRSKGRERGKRSIVTPDGDERHASRIPFFLVSPRFPFCLLLLSAASFTIFRACHLFPVTYWAGGQRRSWEWHAMRALVMIACDHPRGPRERRGRDARRQRSSLNPRDFVHSRRRANHAGKTSSGSHQSRSRKGLEEVHGGGSPRTKLGDSGADSPAAFSQWIN
jgi:hypothetical protein